MQADIQTRGGFSELHICIARSRSRCAILCQLRWRCSFDVDAPSFASNCESTDLVKEAGHINQATFMGGLIIRDQRIMFLGFIRAPRAIPKGGRREGPFTKRLSRTSEGGSWNGPARARRRSKRVLLIQERPLLVCLSAVEVELNNWPETRHRVRDRRVGRTKNE